MPCHFFLDRCLNLLMADRMDIHGKNHLAHELQDGQHHAYIHRHHEISEDGQQKGNEQNQRIRQRRHAKQPHKIADIAHIPGDDKQDCRHSRQRNISRQRRKEQHHAQQDHTMYKPGERARAALPNVRRRAGNRAGSSNAAKQRTDEICQSLPKEFLVRIMLLTGHSIGYNSGKQRFNSAEHRNRKGRTDKRNDIRQLHDGKRKFRQTARNAAKG